MTLRKPMSYLLVLLMAVSGLLSGFSSVYAADSIGHTIYEGEAAGDACVFQMTPEQGASYGRGDTVTVRLSVTAPQPLQARMAQCEIEYSGSVFQFVSGGSLSGNSNVYGENGLIKCVYFSDAKVDSSTLDLGTFTLKVRNSAPQGDTTLHISTANLSDQDGTLISTAVKDTKLTVYNVKPTMYRLSVATDFDTMGTVEGGGYYQQAETVSIKAVPKSGYRFVRWESSGSGTITDPKAAETTFIMGGEAAEVIAVFGPSKERLYEAPLTLTGTEETEFDPGEQFTVNALLQPADKKSYQVRLMETVIPIDTTLFQIDKVEGRTGAVVTTEAAAGAENIRIIYSSQSGTVNGALSLGAITLTVRQDADLKPAELQQQVKGLSDGNYVDPATAISAPSLNIKVGKSLYQLNVTVSDPEKGSVPGAQAVQGEYKAGTALRLTAAAISGNKFVRWESSGGGSFSPAASPETVFTMPKSATTVTAVFIGMEEPVVQPDQAVYDKYLSSGALSFEIDPGEFTFTGIDGMEQGADYTLNENTVAISEETLKSMETGRHTLSFQFGEKTVPVVIAVSDSTPVKYVLTVQSENNEFGIAGTGGSFEEGESVPLIATPRGGYKFVNWVSSGGGSFTDEKAAETSFTMPANDALVTAVFRPESEPEGRLVPDQTGTYDFGRAEERYSSAGSLTVTVTNEGEGRVTALKAALEEDEDGAFTIGTPSVSELGSGEKAVFSVSPKTGLKQGVYEATVAVSGGNSAPTSFRVTFEVIPSSVTGTAVSGTVDRTVGKGMAGATVVLTTKTITTAKEAYAYKAQAGDFTAVVGEDGSYRIEGVAADTYTMLIRMPGAGYYQKNNFQVGGEPITYKNVTLYLGDLNGDGRINATDITVVTNGKNYNKRITDEGVDIGADLNGDGRINATDITSITNAKNYNVRISAE